MSFTYGKVESQVSNLLGNIVGTDMATADTNYQAVASTANRKNVDFPPTAVQDAIVNTVTELFQLISSTPRHPERQLFIDVTAPLANRAQITRLSAGSLRISGVYGRVYDPSDEETCLPDDLDSIRSYNRFKGAGSVYDGFNTYKYALNGQTIEHTRETVVIEVATWQRPTFSPATSIPVDDYHEWPIVCGAVAKIAPREGSYVRLLEYCAKVWSDHLDHTRSYGALELMTEAESAPSTV
jgi:hypothetical protein